jgi:hypothetical protein
MAESERDIRLQIMLQPSELNTIEEWRFSKRMPSRAAAIRELLRRGLAAEGFDIATAGKRSSAFGVTDGAEATSHSTSKRG